MKSAIKMGVVPEFRGDYFFLSNYNQHEAFRWRNNYFTSGEQAFAFAKTFYPTSGNEREADRLAIDIIAAKTPGEAKKLGRKAPLDLSLWDGGHKVQIMREIVHAKFRGVTGYGGKLINTGAMMLVEGNDWGDKFWGRCLDKSTGQMVGLNTLGVILMEERGRWLGAQQLRDSDKPLGG